MGMTLTEAARATSEAAAALSAHLESAKVEEIRLRGIIRDAEAVLLSTEAGLDAEKIALGKTVIYVTDYTRGGQDRASCVSAAVKQLATGVPIRLHYGDLWKCYFGTKNYEGWIGQRSDHEYGYGPRHGSICFEVGLTRGARERKQADLTAEEIEAAIYVLLNVERIQAAEKLAAQKAAQAA